MSTHMGNAAAPQEPVEVLVLDGHEPGRLGLGLLLQRQAWVRRCLLAGTLERAVALSRRHGPRVAVVDVSNAGPFVAELLDPLRAAHEPMRFVLASRCAREPVAPLGRLGAAGFVAPGTAAAAILETVRAAAFDEAPTLAAGLPPEVEPAALTARERDVLALLATGATNPEIARELHLGRDSVKKHATAIYRKLGVRNRTEATRHAARLPAGG